MRVVQALGASVGGIGTYVRDLTEHCVNCGDQVIVIGPASTERHFSFTSTGARFLQLRELRRTLRQADVVHSHGFKAAALTNLARLGRRGPRHVVTLHNSILATGFKARISAVIERLAVRPSDIVLGASADLVQRAAESGARHAALCPVAAPPLPAPARSRAEVRAELGLRDKEALLLTIGRLAPQKSLHTLLDAVAALQDPPARQGPPVRLAIAGDGPEHTALSARIKSGKLPATLLGHRRDIADLLAVADVFVLSSRWEARPLVIQEALRAGVPVVATAVGGIPELVGDAAILVPWNDAFALAAAIRRVLTQPPLSAELRVAGPAHAATWPAPAEALAAARAWYASGNTPRSQGVAT